jgi:phosphoribosylaminoimidazolecarboxamide formyltransferase/IMP cyclohydrolase
MLRSGAKNYSYVTVITDKNDYDMIMEEVKTHGGVRLATRQMLAKKAFAYVAYYDAVIAEFFINYNRHNRPASGISGGDSVACHDDWQFPAYSALPVFKDKTLRYGENPHQDAILLKSSENRGIINAEQIQGKDLSYNNINDADAAFALLEEFNQPACVIVKHASPCGVAVASNIEEAYQQAVLCDNVSVFGGIIAINRPIDAKFASEISKIFVEVIIAPDVSSEAREIFARKKNLRILITQSCSAVKSHKQKLLSLKAVSGGYLAQTEDNIRPFQDYNPQEILLAKYGEGSSSNAKDAASDDKDVATGDAMDDERILSSGVNLAVNIPTKRKPTEQELSEMFFAMAVAKHTKSNAIVLCQGTKTVGISGGQTNRKDSVHFAALRSQELAKNFDKTKGLTLASDAFFPFADGIKMAAEAGVVAIIQPGGSVRDEEVIQEADKHNIAMLFTNIRHFKH